MPRPFRMSVGIFAKHATTGYPFAVPKDDSLVLSAYKMKARGFPPGGSCDYKCTTFLNKQSYKR